MVETSLVKKQASRGSFNSEAGASELKKHLARHVFQ